MQLNPQDLDEGSFAQLLAGGQPAQEAPQQGGGLGELISGARSGLQTNPAIANALLQTFATMARSSGANFWDAAGTGVAQGAQTFMMHGAQEKDDAEKQAAVQRQTAEKDRNFSLAEKKTNAGIEASKANVKANEASTAVNLEKLQQDKDLFTDRKNKLAIDIEAMRQKIQSARTDDERLRLNMQLTKLKMSEAKMDLEFNKRFKPLLGEAELALKNAQVANEQEEGVGQILENDMAQMKRDALATMTPEQLAAGNKISGTPTVNKELSDSQLYVAFEKQFSENLMPNAKVDPAEKQAAWIQFYRNARSAPTPGEAPAAAAAAQPATPGVSPVGTMTTGRGGIKYRKAKAGPDSDKANWEQVK